jgi:oxygen-independent coproporphyrinogen-3 oxidase
MAGLYIHIPFCTEKCLYCDFFSGNQLYLLDDYVEAVCREIVLRKCYITENKINTIYFGGGTPSLLSKCHFELFFETIFTNYDVNAQAEITIECNPENIDNDYLDLLYKVGFNRISLGIQFLEDNVLRKYNRHHSKDLIINALRCIGNSRFTNLSVDLIYSVPGIGNSLLKSTLSKLLDFDIKHISAYSLTVSKNSQLYWKIRKGEILDGSESIFLEQYRIIDDFCEDNGFLQYEISNYAKLGYISKHNMSYWNQDIYLGVGVTAHSYNLVSRQWNHSNIKKYVREGKNDIFTEEIEKLTDIQLYNEYVILRLRTFLGLSSAFVKERFDADIHKHFVKNLNILIVQNHFICIGELVIPRKEDFLLADYLAKVLMI